MPQTYSADLRRRIVSFVERGHSRREAAHVFDVSPSFVIVLMRQYKASGTLTGSPCGGTRHNSLSRYPWDARGMDRGCPKTDIVRNVCAAETGACHMCKDERFVQASATVERYI